MMETKTNQPEARVLGILLGFSLSERPLKKAGDVKMYRLEARLKETNPAVELTHKNFAPLGKTECRFKTLPSVRTNWLGSGPRLRGPRLFEAPDLRGRPAIQNKTCYRISEVRGSSEAVCFPCDSFLPFVQMLTIFRGHPPVRLRFFNSTSVHVLCSFGNKTSSHIPKSKRMQPTFSAKGNCCK